MVGTIERPHPPKFPISTFKTISGMEESNDLNPVAGPSSLRRQPTIQPVVVVTSPEESNSEPVGMISEPAGIQSSYQPNIEPLPPSLPENQTGPQVTSALRPPPIQHNLRQRRTFRPHPLRPSSGPNPVPVTPTDAPEHAGRQSSYFPSLAPLPVETGPRVTSVLRPLGVEHNLPHPQRPGAYPSIPTSPVYVPYPVRPSQPIEAQIPSLSYGYPAPQANDYGGQHWSHSPSPQDYPYDYPPHPSRRSRPSHISTWHPFHGNRKDELTMDDIPVFPSPPPGGERVGTNYYPTPTGANLDPMGIPEDRQGVLPPAHVYEGRPRVRLRTDHSSFSPRRPMSPMENSRHSNNLPGPTSEHIPRVFDTEPTTYRLASPNPRPPLNSRPLHVFLSPSPSFSSESSLTYVPTQSHYYPSSHYSSVPPGHSNYRTGTELEEAYKSELSNKEKVSNFITYELPKRLYQCLLLGLPALYKSRVIRIFKEADMIINDLKKMALETPMHCNVQEGKEVDMFLKPTGFEPSVVPKPYVNLKLTWEAFIDSLMREWNTFNIISVLLLTAIITILQIDSAAADPVTRFSALLSLVCALVSLLYGCMYIIRFGSMRMTSKAAEWALEGEKRRDAIFWNMWILLAMPLIWLIWSILFYVICIVYFVWRTGPDNDKPPPMTNATILGPRIAVSLLFVVALIYFIVIFKAFRKYGDEMDKRWMARRKEYFAQKEKDQRFHPSGGYSSYAPQRPHGSVPPSQPYGVNPSGLPYPYVVRIPPDGIPVGVVPPEQPRSPPKPRPRPRIYSSSSSESDSSFESDTDSIADHTINPSTFKAVRVMDVRLPFDHSRQEVFEFLNDHQISHEIWTDFVEDIIRTWVDKDSPTLSSDESERMLQLVIRKWNVPFYRLGAEVIMCKEYFADSQKPPAIAIYLVECPTTRYLPISNRFTSIPEGLARIELFDNILSEQSSIFTDKFKPTRETTPNVRFDEANTEVEVVNPVRKKKKKKGRK